MHYLTYLRLLKDGNVKGKAGIEYVCSLSRSYALHSQYIHTSYYRTLQDVPLGKIELWNDVMCCEEERIEFFAHGTDLLHKNKQTEHSGDVMALNVSVPLYRYELWRLHPIPNAWANDSIINTAFELMQVSHLVFDVCDALVDSCIMFNTIIYIILPCFAGAGFARYPREGLPQMLLFEFLFP